MDNYLIRLFVLLLILFIGRNTEIEKIERPGFENSTTLENSTNILFIQYTAELLFDLRSNIINNNESELMTFWDGSNIYNNLSYEPQVGFSPRYSLQSNPRFSINPLFSSILKNDMQDAAKRKDKFILLYEN